MNPLTLCRCAALSLTLSLTPTAFAASTVDVAVHGIITPSACTPLLGQGGLIDYGKIAARDLNRETFTKLPNTDLAIGVDCEAATLFALKFTDNRAGSSASQPHGFGFGVVNGNEKVGVFHTILHTPLADNAPITQLQSLNNGQTWTVVEENVSLPALRLAAFGNNASGAWRPLPIRELRVQLRISAFIAPAQGLTLDREVPLDGSATLDLIYL